MRTWIRLSLASIAASVAAAAIATSSLGSAGSAWSGPDGPDTVRRPVSVSAGPEPGGVPGGELKRRTVVVAKQRVSGPAAASGEPERSPSGTPDWDAIAACESSGRWDLNTGNGFWGGLQFLPSTWFAYGGGPFDGKGPFPYSREQQIAVAERVLAGQGPGAWPNCFRWA